MINLPLLHFIVSLFDIQAELNFWQPQQNTSFTVLVGLVQLIFQKFVKKVQNTCFHVLAASSSMYPYKSISICYPNQHLTLWKVGNFPGKLCTAFVSDHFENL